MSFIFEATELKGLIKITPQAFPDDRGVFWESYRRSEFVEHGITAAFVQDNVSISTKGVLRGLHFQKEPHAQGKLVSVIRGTVLDVVVDVRPESPTRGRYLKFELTGDGGTSLYVPPGFAHGFVVLSDEVIFTYKVTADYCPTAEDGILWNDETLDIDWQIDDPIISEKDAILPPYAEVTG